MTSYTHRKWGSIEEAETKRRIRVALWAYAYEVHSDSLVDDVTFDKECESIDLSVNTLNKDMDTWYRENFDPCTGQWVHNHPNKEGLERLYQLTKGTGATR